MNVSEAYDIFRNMAYESGLRAGEDPHDYMCGFFKQAVSDDGLDCGSYIIYGAHIWWC